MDTLDVGDLIVVSSINSFKHFRDDDVGKVGIVVRVLYDWALQTDILYAEVEGKRKGFYLSEVKLLCKYKNES